MGNYSLLTDIEPLKQTALAELKAAPDLAALEQNCAARTVVQCADETARYALKRNLPPATINVARSNRSHCLARREELNRRRAAKELTISSLPDAAPAIASAHGHRRYRPALRSLCCRGPPGSRTSIIASTRALNTPAGHPGTPTRKILYIGAPSLAQSLKRSPHTSFVQIRAENSRRPCASLCAGRVVAQRRCHAQSDLPADRALT